MNDCIAYIDNLFDSANESRFLDKRLLYQQQQQQQQRPPERINQLLEYAHVQMETSLLS